MIPKNCSSNLVQIWHCSKGILSILESVTDTGMGFIKILVECFVVQNYYECISDITHKKHLDAIILRSGDSLYTGKEGG